MTPIARRSCIRAHPAGRPPTFRRAKSARPWTATITLALAAAFALPPAATTAASDPVELEPFFHPPAEFSGDLGAFRSPLYFEDGRKVQSAEHWRRRRDEILQTWHRFMGPWPPLLARPEFSVLATERQENVTLQRVRIEIASGRFEQGWYLTPAGTGPFPAVLVPFYDPETSIGRQGRLRDFAWQLARRGFVTLSIGSPGGNARLPEPGDRQDTTTTTTPPWQPLSFLACVAANAHTALARRPEIDASRIGVVGHSYGGKWALFAGALHEKFACVVVSDPGIVWDESRPNVNYWEPWYLGRDWQQNRRPGVLAVDQPRTGAYRDLVAHGHDLTELHALLAPRPFLVSGGAEDPPERWRALNHLLAVNRLLGVTNRVALTSRPTHDPTPESNAQIYAFFERFLGPLPGRR